MLKVEIFDGDIGSVQNRMNKFFADHGSEITEIVSVTQSKNDFRSVIITIIYKEKIRP